MKIPCEMFNIWIKRGVNTNSEKTTLEKTLFDVYWEDSRVHLDTISISLMINLLSFVLVMYQTHPAWTQRLQ